ncbi:MAG: hypothetical protein WD848_09865 [Dehalococcoidia bacterium]
MDLRDRFKLAMLAVFVLGVVVASWLLVANSGHNADRESAAREAGQQQLSEAALVVDSQLNELKSAVETVADQLNSGQVDQAGLNALLPELLEEHPRFWSLGVAYDFWDTGIDYDYTPSDPAALNTTPYFIRPGGEVTLNPFPYEYFDRTEGTDGWERGWWFRDGLDIGRHWTGAYFGNTSRRMIAEYVAPFEYGGADGDLPADAGVVLATYTLENLNRDVSWLDLGAAGYGLMISDEGNYVIHPLPEYWLGGRNIADLGDLASHDSQQGAEARRDALTEAAERSQQGHAGWAPYQDEITGRDAWLFYQPVPSTGWTLGYVLIKSEVLGGDDVSRRQQMGAGTALLMAAFALMAVGFRACGGNLWTVWGTSFSFSLACVGGIAFIWILTTSLPSSPTQLTDGESLRSTVDRFEAGVKESNRDAEVIEAFAGVFVQSVEFTSDDNVVVTGIAWQRYFDNAADVVEPGFTFPDDVSITDFDVAYDITNGPQRVIGWRFRSTLQTSFDYSRYPFDVEDVSIRMWHRDFDQPIVLIPDIPEYDVIVPVAKPGLEEEFDVNGWEIDRSFFNYSDSSFNARFGIPDFSRVGRAPELYFNVRLNREFLNTFISRMLPLIVVSVLVFAMLNTVTAGQTQKELFGTTTATVLAFSGSLMFVTIVGHNSLRSSLNASQLIYLEYFYFVMYLAILAVAVNTILFNSGHGGRLIGYRDNMIAKVLYWPLVTGTTFLVTWLQFF